MPSAAESAERLPTDERKRVDSTSEFTRRVARGQNQDGVSDYLHNAGYLDGPRLQTALRRNERARRRLARYRDAVLTKG